MQNLSLKIDESPSFQDQDAHEAIKHHGGIFPCVPLREWANIRSQILEFPITGDEV